MAMIGNKRIRCQVLANFYRQKGSEAGILVCHWRPLGALEGEKYEPILSLIRLGDCCRAYILLIERNADV